MSKTVADASRDYRQRQRAKLERYEAALKRIVSGEFADPRILMTVANEALQDQ